MRYAAVALVVIVGCAGEITTTGGNGSGSNPDMPDAGNTGSGSPDAATIMPDAPVNTFQCRNKVNNVGSGNHHPGQDCQGACHNHGFTIGGTLFAAPNSTTPFVGGTITIVDAANKTVDVVSQQNGNFYTSQALTFPLKVTASACPSVAGMSTLVTANNDGCNKGGCHVAGAQGVIHLP